MSKFLDLLNKLGERHRKRIEREIKMDEFLNGSKDNCLRINEINKGIKTLASTVDNMNTKVNSLDSTVTSIKEKVNSMEYSVDSIGAKVDNLENEMDRLHTRLDLIGQGTQKELYDTLYHWKKILVERGWKTPSEMDEIDAIYRIYHDGLGGNGQGEKYYKEIEALPEKEPTNS